jgi:hypothetical protein
MVIPLARARTQSRGLLDAPNQLNLNDRPQCGFRQAALSKLAVERLQRRFSAGGNARATCPEGMKPWSGAVARALLTKATLRLNAIYIPAGLIMAVFRKNHADAAAALAVAHRDLPVVVFHDQAGDVQSQPQVHRAVPAFTAFTLTDHGLEQVGCH